LEVVVLRDGLGQALVRKRNDHRHGMAADLRLVVLGGADLRFP
jgi:hypothetical protein